MTENTFYILSIVIFVLVYIMIIWDKFDRTLIALGGAMLMIILRVLNQEEAFGAIDFNTITLLIGMMMIVMVMRRTGIFEYLAIKVVKVSKADPQRLIILLFLVTGILSALLDNVTTILLIIPVTLSVAKDLKLDPIPFIIAEIFASNVGGTATLIGDPPNIMIGSEVGLNFMDFLVNNGLIALPLLVLMAFLFALLYKKVLVADESVKEKVLSVNENEAIHDPLLLKKSLIVFSFVILGFLLNSVIHIDSSTIAFTGAVVLIFMSGITIEEILREVEWKTIFFFIGLFILVGGLEATGVIQILAGQVLSLTGGDVFLTTIAILWVSAIASAFVDNIPFVATMIPMILEMGQLSGMNLYPLWWALSLGACLGGNGTVIGASANVVAIGLAEGQGYRITFGKYFRVAFPFMILSIIVSMIYIVIRYLI
ncbi:SLC13 family permease [Acetobacterium bakii]|uniref:Membrane protein n=1 Tax=Acetobacterium bakii TaxID=52689 RepID=A0A0L6TX99_9FIRM|nr:ArsB/NhaD family transporter [Acetobacterium bakii]KNZ40868.1 membrane protein [Acetobacterium bakii]